MWGEWKWGDNWLSLFHTSLSRVIVLTSIGAAEGENRNHFRHLRLCPWALLWIWAHSTRLRDGCGAAWERARVPESHVKPTPVKMNNWGEGVAFCLLLLWCCHGNDTLLPNEFFFIFWSCSPAHRYQHQRFLQHHFWVGGPFVSELSQTPPQKVGISHGQASVYWFISVHMLSGSSAARVCAIGLLACVKPSENNNSLLNQYLI